jgi:hypothetical protein
MVDYSPEAVGSLIVKLRALFDGKSHPVTILERVACAEAANWIQDAYLILTNYGVIQNETD